MIQKAILLFIQLQIQLTNNKNPPKAKQNTNGPAISVSSKILFSGFLIGFNTERVCKIK